jgi:hypothetical protein
MRPFLIVLGLVAGVLLVGAIAHADKRLSPKPQPIVGRVVSLEVYPDTTVVTVLVGYNQGIEKTWHAKFREGTTTTLLGGGEATIIRIDRRTTLLKTSLTPEQVRAHRFVQFEP